jgi:putative membrane protein
LSEEIVGVLPHVNASLNGLATVLLVVGFTLIKLRKESAHKWVMLACFAVSAIFLASYLTYHFNIGPRLKKFPFDEYPTAAYVYYAILISHILLAITVPFLAIATIYLGLADKRKGHMRLARWTFPIWLYVSVTGVIVYVMLYQIFQPHG